MDMDELLELRRAREWLASGAGRAIRESAGLSLHELAQAIPVAPSTLLRWERGDHRPRGRSGVRYAEALRELAEGRTGPRPAPASSVGERTFP
jgi:transcriptional regulator with XRE-family HTH domain